jgi:hypothetical protein
MSQTTTSHRRTSRATVMIRRLLRTQLRFKVMAGVLAVTLVALVAFDVAAVTTVRRYLLNQTDNNLQGALTLTLPRLAGFLAAGQAANHAVAGPRGPNELPSQRVLPPNDKIPALPGAYDMVFLPLRGEQVTLQVAANSGTKTIDWTLPPRTAKIAARPGPHTLIGPNGTTHIRIVSRRAPGGSLVAGTSLDQVYETIVQVELIVLLGSIAVVLLIGFGRRQRGRNRRAGHHRGQRRRPRRSARPAAAHLRALLPRGSPVPAPRLWPRAGHRRRDRLRARRPRVRRAGQPKGPARPADHTGPPGRRPASRRPGPLRRRPRANGPRVQPALTSGSSTSAVASPP